MSIELYLDLSLYIEMLCLKYSNGINNWIVLGFGGGGMHSKNLLPIRDEEWMNQLYM